MRALLLIAVLPLAACQTRPSVPPDGALFVTPDKKLEQLLNESLDDF